MVIPCLRSHLYRHEHTEQSNNSSNGCWVNALHLTGNHVVKCSHTHTTPYCESIERTGISIVALTGLHRCLVKVNNDGQTCHKEQEEHNPELTYASTASPCLPEQADESEQQRQAIEHVVSLVVLKVIGQLALVTIHQVINERDACNPVAVLCLSITLNVVLSATEIPHKVAPVHKVALIREEEAYVVPL